MPGGLPVPAPAAPAPAPGPAAARSDARPAGRTLRRAGERTGTPARPRRPPRARLPRGPARPRPPARRLLAPVAAGRSLAGPALPRAETTPVHRPPGPPPVRPRRPRWSRPEPRAGSGLCLPTTPPPAPRPRGPTPTSAPELRSAPLLLAQGDLGNPDSDRPSQVTRKAPRVTQRLPGSFWMRAPGEGAG